MNKKLKIGLLLITILGVLFIGTAVVTASGLLIPFNQFVSSNSTNPDDMILVGTITLPPSDAVYDSLPTGKVEPNGDYPVAVLNSKSATYAQLISAYQPDLSKGVGVAVDDEAFTIISSIRYSTSNGDIYVTTTLPSPNAAKKSLFLGDKEIKLADGNTAWATELSQGNLPNRLLYIDGDLIITIASSLPMENLQKIPADIIVINRK